MYVRMHAFVWEEVRTRGMWLYCEPGSCLGVAVVSLASCFPCTQVCISRHIVYGDGRLERMGVSSCCSAVRPHCVPKGGSREGWWSSFPYCLLLGVTTVLVLGSRSCRLCVWIFFFSFFRLPLLLSAALGVETTPHTEGWLGVVGLDAVDGHSGSQAARRLPRPPAASQSRRVAEPQSRRAPA